MMREKNSKGVCVSKPLLFILLWMSLNQTGLTKDFRTDRDLIFGKKIHLHFNTPFSFSPRAKTDFHHPDFKQKFFPSSNFSFGITMMYNFNTKYSLSAGFNIFWLSYLSIRSNYYIPEKYTQMYVSNGLYNYTGPYIGAQTLNPYNYFWSFPVKFVHRIILTKKIDFNYELGLNFKVCYPYDFEEKDAYFDFYNDSTPVAYEFRYDIGINKKRSLKMDALFSAGINRYLKNNKYINCNIFISVPMYKPLRGEFGFLLDTPYEALGTFKKSDLAFGFEFNYIFTFRKREKRLPGKKTEVD